VAVSGGGAIGSIRRYFYPGVTDELKAVPVRVIGGEDIRIGTLTLPPREKGEEVRVRISGAPTGQNIAIRVDFAEGSLSLPLASNQREIDIASVAPGHYDIVVSNNLPLMSGFFYGRTTLDVSASSIEQEVIVGAGAKITGKILLQNIAGDRSPAPATVICRLRSRFGLSNCTGSQVVPGPQEIELDGLTMDTYVLSAKSGDKDILAEGFNVSGDAEVEIVLASPGTIVRGIVRNTGGDSLPDATVVLVPDPPFRQTGILFKSVITDANGKFEIHGIAPGPYKLFAWSELEGLAYRNSEFMKGYEDRGTPVTIDNAAGASFDITAF
jgi:hypothetical protein